MTEQKADEVGALRDQVARLRVALENCLDEMEAVSRLIRGDRLFGETLAAGRALLAEALQEEDRYHDDALAAMNRLEDIKTVRSAIAQAHWNPERNREALAALDRLEGNRAKYFSMVRDALKDVLGAYPAEDAMRDIALAALDRLEVKKHDE